jgi:hypothetical protein
MATIDLGAIRFNWKGAYNNSTAYVADDVVSFGGASYINILASTGVAVSNTSNWSVMSTAGIDGTDGTDLGTVLTTQGDIAFRDGSGLQKLAKGTGTQTLRMNSGATAPEWVTPVSQSSIGLSTIWVPAVAMYPTTTLPCEALAQVEITAQRPELKTLNFKVAADSYAQFAIAFPKSWDKLTLKYRTYWSVEGTDVNTVVFTLSAVAVSSDDPMNPAFPAGVANTALAHSGTANDLMVNALSNPITVGESPADGDQVFFQVMRDVSAGTQPADVRLLGIKLFYTTNAENDA